MANSTLWKQPSKNKKTSTFLSEILPFFMPLIVFIETVGISQKKILKKLSFLIFVLADKKKFYTVCNFLPSPLRKSNYYETNSPVFKKHIAARTRTRNCPIYPQTTCPPPTLDLKKIMLFLLFVVFIQLPMVCVTFSEKSYLVLSLSWN